eukprot:gene234-4480_t
MVESENTAEIIEISEEESEYETDEESDDEVQYLLRKQNYKTIAIGKAKRKREIEIQNSKPKKKKKTEETTSDSATTGWDSFNWENGELLCQEIGQEFHNIYAKIPLYIKMLKDIIKILDYEPSNEPTEFELQYANDVKRAKEKWENLEPRKVSLADHEDQKGVLLGAVGDKVAFLNVKKNELLLFDESEIEFGYDAIDKLSKYLYHVTWSSGESTFEGRSLFQ